MPYGYWQSATIPVNVVVGVDEGGVVVGGGGGGGGSEVGGTVV